MDSAVLPAQKRLIAALEEAQRTTQKIGQIIHRAEDDAAALFKGSMAGAALSAAAGAAAGSAIGGAAGGAAGAVAGSAIGGAVGGTAGAVVGGAVGAAGGAAAGGGGKSLKVTGDTQGFADMANAVIGVQYEVVVGADGTVSLQRTNAQGPLTPAGQELVNTLQTVMSDPNPTTLEFVRGESTVIGGQYTTGKIDLDDAQQFGNGVGQGLNMGGVLVHEITEQYRKQVHGESFPVAHAAALDAEARAVGAPRGTETFKTINASTTEITFPYTYPGGNVVNVVLTVANGNITNVTR